MGYRNLTQEQFGVVRNAASKVCTENDLKTIGEFKRVGNLIIDALELGTLCFADLLQEKIPLELPILAPEPKGV